MRASTRSGRRTSPPTSPRTSRRRSPGAHLSDACVASSAQQRARFLRLLWEGLADVMLLVLALCAVTALGAANASLLFVMADAVVVRWALDAFRLAWCGQSGPIWAAGIPHHAPPGPPPSSLHAG
jgi:hypothetical protein